MLTMLDKFANELQHSNRSLLNHLEGTADILRKWGANADIINAARYHTIYSTETFSFKFSVPLQDRSLVADIMGEKAERLLYLYAFKKSGWINQAVYSSETIVQSSKLFFMPLRNSTDYEPIDSYDLKCIVAIILANAVEQAARQPLAEYNESHWQTLANFSSEVLPQINLEAPLVNYLAIEDNNELSELIKVLKWEESVSVKTVTKRFDQTCSRKFKQLLNTVDEALFKPVPCNYIYSQLNEQSRMLCALSPKIIERYLTPNLKLSPEDCLNIYAWMNVQAFSEGIVEKITAKNASADDRYKWCLNSDKLIAVPATVARLPIDLGDSPYDEVWLRGNHTSDIMPYKESDGLILKDRLDAAFLYIKEVDIRIVHFAINAVRVISVRKDNIHNSSHGSSSWPNMPGLIGLINVHKEEIPLEKTVSAIIHEAVHNYLYQIEIFTPFSSETNRFYGIKTRSPWTGRELPLASFIHACFVWFALFNFWNLSLLKFGQNTFVQSEIEKLRNGFNENSYLIEIERNKTLIRPDIYSVLRRLREAVLL